MDTSALKISWVGAFMLLTISVFAQVNGKKIVAKGNEAFQNKNYEEALKLYEEGAVDAEYSQEAMYNAANALYRTEKFEEAAEAYQSLGQMDLSASDKAQVYHNLGNSLLQTQKLEESIEAYKESLKLAPHDEETRYNLAKAKKMLQKQQQQQKDQKKDQDKKDEEKKDDKQQDEQKQQDQQQEQKEEQEKQEQEEQQKQDQQQQEQQKQQQQQQQQQKEMAKKKAERMLDALNQEEKGIQKKVKKQTGKAQKRNIEKDW